MYFNRRNTEQKNWRMIKKGKHFLFGCSLVLAVGASFVASSVKADTVEPQPESSSTSEEEKPTSKEESGSGTYVAPAATVASTTVTESNTAPVTDEKPKEGSEATVEKSKESDAIQAPSLTMVADPAALTEEEKANIGEAVKGVNPTATDVQVQSDGTVVVTFADGSSATLTAAETIKEAPKAEISATEPKSRSRRAVGQERSMEGRDIKYVYQNRTAQVNSGTPTQRAKIEYRQLDDYEVVDGKTVATDPSGQGRPVLEWTVTFNEAQYDKMGGYYYFTIPKNVSDPSNVVTDYDGAYVDRDGWKDANKESGAGSANAEGVQYVDAGNKLEWRVKNTVGRDYNNVDGLSGVMGDTKKVYVLQLSNSSSARKFTIKYRTIVEDSSQAISYIAGVESKTGLPRNNWYAISGKYDKNLVSQVDAPRVTPNLTNTSVNVPIQTVASTSSTLSGTGVPGATIKLYIDGQEQNIGTVTVDNDGNWTTGELPTALNNNQGDGTTIKPRQTVQVSQVVNGGESSRRTVPVSVGVTTVEPSSLTTNQDAVVAGQKEVTLKVPHDAGIAYLRYTNTAGETAEIPVKRDNVSSAWTSQKPEAATVKSVENGKFQDTIVLTMADKIAGTEVAAISNVVEGGFSSVADWQPRSVENQAPTIASAVEGNRKTVQQGAQLDLASLVTVADKEDDAQATLGDKVHAEVVSVNGNTATKTVDTNTQGTYTVKYKAADSQGKESNEIEVTVVVNPARQNEAPTVEIPYSDPAPDKKDIYIYNGEEVDIDITFNDDSGKIQSAALKRGGNIALRDIGENKQDNEWGLVTTVIKNETTTPATIKITGTVTGVSDNRIPKTESQSLPIVSRYATATDLDGKYIENQATKFNAGTNIVSESYKTDPGAFTITLKAQTAKYDIKTPASADKLIVSDANNISNEDFEKIKAKVKIEYSNNNIDMRLADKKGEVVDNQTERIESITREGNNVVVTYKDGSKDTKALADFVNVAPTVEIPYSNQANKQIYVYTGENTDLTFKGTDENEVKDLYLRGPGDISKDNTTDYGFTTGKITDGTVTTGVGEVSADKRTATVKMTGKTNLAAGKEWTSFVVSKDNDGKLSNTDYRALDKDPNAKEKPGYVRFVVKNQTSKYDIATPTEKVEVANPDNVTNDELNKIKEKLQLEYSQTNDDANLADKKGTTVADKNNKIQSVTKDADGNLVVTYTDGSTDKKPLSEFVTDTTAPAKPVVDTDLTGKAGTKTPVEVSAEPGSTVGLFDKDGNKIGEGTADENGKATITPTVDLPEGNVTAKATDPAGNTSDASDPAKATDTTAPAKPVVDTDLTGKAGTKTPVEVSAEPGSTVELFDKDGNKIGEGTADENGKATITPTVDLPEGNVTAKATDPAGNTSDASDPAKATDTTAPAKPVVDTDLTGKAGTKTPVEVSAEPGSTVELFDKDGNKIGEGTADENGKATITPTVDLPEGNVTAKATDPAGNTSDASDPAKATDTTAPAKPVVDTDLTGKAGTKTPVEVSAEPGSTVELFDKDGNKIGEGTADENGKATITPTVDLPEGNVTAKATDPAGNTSDASDPAKATDTTAPAKPVVDTDLTGKAGTKTPVEVSAEPGSTVELFDKDGNKIGEGTADENGKATITPTVDLPEGNVTAKATDPVGNTSDASDPAKATDTTAPAKPVVDTDLTGKAGTKTPVEVSAEPGSTVELFDKDGNKIGEGTADENGKATITPTVDLPEGNVTAKATDPAGNTSDASDPAKATDTTAPAKPVVDTDLTGKAGTKTPVEVSAEPGSTVELFDKDGNKIGEGTADENGKATITPTVDLPEGNVTAKATDPAGNTSDASDPAKATDTTAPAKPVVDTDLTGKAGTKTPVEVSAEPGSTVELFDKDGNKIGEGTADENGKATITPTVDLPEGNVTAKATDPAGNTSDASDPAKATDTTAPAKPVVDTDLTGKAGTKTPVEVSAEPGSTVELFDKDGNKIGEGTADENGKATITPTVDLPEGNVTAKATDPAGNTSDASDPAKATDTTAPAKPVVDTDLTGKAGTKTPVEVSAEPGSTVELFDKDGNKIGEGTADENGKATITPTVDLPEGNVTAKATDPAGNTSDASDPAKATDTTAPAKPVVDTDLTGKAGTKTPVEVSAEPGSTVELFDKDGNKIGEGTADENGKATITPTVDLPEGNVTAKATDPAGNTSDASDPAKATDTTAPAKPVVDTDLTGKAGTKTPVEVSAEPGSTVELFDKDGNKIGEGTADENGKATITPTVDLPEGNVTAKATDPVGNTSDASDPAKATDTTAPAKPVVDTDLTGKAGTKTPVEVSAEPGSTVELFDKDGNKIGEGTADENGKATITPTVDLPEGNVTAKATDPAGNTSDASDPAKATDTTAPAKPVVDTDLTGKAGTKTPVEVSAEPGSTVELFDKDGNKIGEGTADENGKATITPTVDLPEGNVTAKATDPAGNTSDASDPAKATDTTAPAKPVVDTDLTGKAGTKTPVEVSAEPGSTVELFDKDGNKIGEGTADENGKATITPTVDLPEGNVTAKATDPAGNTSDASDPAKATSDDQSAKDPAVTPVVDPSNLTDAEKAKVADEVKKANPTASKVEVGNDGTATVTYPDGTTAVIPADKTVKKSDDQSAKDPAVTPVVDPSNLTDAEKAKVADEVKKANPTASKVEVGNDGTATVTYPDGTTAVIPADKTVKKSDDQSAKDPAVTPVVDPSNLTDAEKAKVADEVKKANPTASKVEVGNDGTATVTYPDGTTAVIPADKTVKKSDDQSVKDPAVTPVVDPSNLTDAEKAKVADEVKKANPTASKVEVGNDGTATVTYPDGTTAVIPADKTVKKSDDQSAKDPAVTPVVDPSNLTDAEKAKVADEVKKANPTASKVEVGNDGTATVTYPDGTTAVIPADKTVKKSDDQSAKDPAVTPVVDPSNLTDAEKAKVADEVKKANPTASKVEVGNDGTATVTYPDGTTAVIPADKTVKKSDDQSAKDPAVTPVVDPSNLTDAEKAKVADEVKKANPTASKVEVGNDGTATVTYPDGTTAVIPADKTVKKSDDQSAKDPAVTPVVDPSNLTDAEKAKVADEVKKANPTASKVEVGNDGTATVTYPDGTTAVIPADKTVKKSDDQSAKDPAVTPVVDPSNLTDAEKAKVADEVKKANPTASKVEVGNDGTATVTYPDGTTAVIPADKTVKKSDDQSAKDPAVTPVVDPSNLTDAEKAKVADEVKKANPTASKVEVGNDGTATVTYPDGTTAVIPADKTVKKSDDQSAKDPAVTPVVDPSNLTDAEKAKVADEVKKANPTASKVEVGNDGTATVTYPDGTTAVIPADKTVKKSDDQSAKDPAVTPVVDPSNLTDAEKAKVADEVKKANPTASKVEVGNDGTATVTYPDGTTAILTPKQTITKVSETGNKGNSNSNSDNNSDKTSNTFVKVPAEKTLVKDPSNLTDAERSEIVSKIKQVNPGATVKVDRYGNATVELNGKTVVISSGQLIVSAEETNGQASHQGRVATDSSKKSESGKLPSTGEEQSVASIGLAILSALTGGLLLSKKRKEEE